MKYTLLHHPCPECPSSDAYCLYEDGHGYCYSCEYYKPANGEFLETNDLYTYEYLPHRGLSKRTLEFYDIKTKIDKNGKPIADGFLYPSGCTKVRDLDNKDFKWIKPPNIDQVPSDLFGANKFDPGAHKYIIITEGEYDAASLYQATQVPSVSVRSSSSAVSDCGLCRSFLNAHTRIYLAFDNDAPGRAARENVARLFDHDKVYVLDFQRRKDANEYLQAGEADELKNLFANAQKFLPQSVVLINSKTIAEILSKQPSVGVPYPFPKLNTMLHGLRTGESVLITAPPGVGKTEVMHAIEHQLLRETEGNIGAIFLEEPDRDHLRSLASIELGRPAFVPSDGVTDTEISAALERLLKTNNRLYLYHHFGTDDPVVLLDTIRYLAVACDVRYVLLDHISMAVSGTGSERDERKTYDFLSTRLEMLVKELDIGLIFVSHVNDMGQTRGSRAMEQLCDIRIDLSRDVKTGSNVIDFNISKSRPPMTKSGEAGSYIFDTFRRKYTSAELQDG